MTMSLVSTVTVGTDLPGIIDFTSITQTGTDVLILLSARDFSNTAFDIGLRFNGSQANFNSRRLLGNGTTASSGANSTNYFTNTQNWGSSTSNTFNNLAIYIPNYAGASQKSFSIDSVTEHNATTSYQSIVAGLWANTAAITSIGVLTSNAFAQYSTASLYTITKGSGGATTATA